MKKIICGFEIIDNDGKSLGIYKELKNAENKLTQENDIMRRKALSLRRYPYRITPVFYEDGYINE